jgi:hypothetical protein
VTQKKYFLHPRLVIYFFSYPTHKTKIGTAKRSETTDSNPPGAIKLSSQSAYIGHILSTSGAALRGSILGGNVELMGKAPVGY